MPSKQFKSIFVVSTASGFVGAFTKPQLVKKLTSSHMGVKFLVEAYPLYTNIPTSSVYLVQQEDRTTIYASNSKEAAERYQRAYASVGRACTDDLDYWCYPVNEVQEMAAQELQRSAVEPTQEDLDRNEGALRKIIEAMKVIQEHFDGAHTEPDEDLSIMPFISEADVLDANVATSRVLAGEEQVIYDMTVGSAAEDELQKEATEDEPLQTEATEDEPLQTEAQPVKEQPTEDEPQKEATKDVPPANEAPPVKEQPTEQT